MSDLALRPVRRTDLDALVTLCAEHAAYEGCVYAPGWLAASPHGRSA